MTRAPAPPPAGDPSADARARPGHPRGLLKGAFGLVARLRPGGRAVHDRGAVFAAELHVPARPWRCGVEVFDAPGRWPGLARFSRGFGLPRPLPDVLGLAVRVESAAGPWDLLADSVVGAGPWQRRLGLPVRDHLGATYSSILAFRLGPGRAPVLLLALPVSGSTPGLRTLADLAGADGLGGAAFDLALAGRGGSPVPLARLTLGLRLPDGAEPHFDPTAGGTLTPAGPLGRLRVASYPASPVGG